MKRTLLLAATAATLFATNANAQLGVQKVTGKVVPTFTLGVKAGVNMQSMSGSNATWDDSYKLGVLGGIFASVNKNKIGVRVEGLVKTAKIDVAGTSTSVNTVGLDIPVLFEYRLIKRVWLQVGPQFTSLISAKHTNGTDVKNSFTNSDISAVGGIEVQLPMKFTVGARYILGLADVNNTAAPGTWKNTSLQFSVGYRIVN